MPISKPRDIYILEIKMTNMPGGGRYALLYFIQYVAVNQ